MLEQLTEDPLSSPVCGSMCGMKTQHISVLCLTGLLWVCRFNYLWHLSDPSEVVSVAVLVPDQPKYVNGTTISVIPVKPNTFIVTQEIIEFMHEKFLLNKWDKILTDFGV